MDEAGRRGRHLESHDGNILWPGPCGLQNLVLDSGGLAEDEMISTLISEYEVDEQRLRSDLRELIDQLAGKSLVTLSNEKEPPR